VASEHSAGITQSPNSLSCTVGSDKAPRTYQKGRIKRWENRTDIWGAGIVGTDGEGVIRNDTVFEWKGTDRVSLIGYCGAFQAGQFGLGQPVDYRADDDQRVYIRGDNRKECECKVEGQKAPEEAKSVAPLAKP
jgi:hypothetical protein